MACSTVTMMTIFCITLRNIDPGEFDYIYKKKSSSSTIFFIFGCIAGAMAKTAYKKLLVIHNGLDFSLFSRKQNHSIKTDHAHIKNNIKPTNNESIESLDTTPKNVSMPSSSTPLVIVSPDVSVITPEQKHPQNISPHYQEVIRTTIQNIDSILSSLIILVNDYETNPHKTKSMFVADFREILDAIISIHKALTKKLISSKFSKTNDSPWKAEEITLRLKKK